MSTSTPLNYHLHQRNVERETSIILPESMKKSELRSRCPLDQKLDQSNTRTYERPDWKASAQQLHQLSISNQLNAIKLIASFWAWIHFCETFLLHRIDLCFLFCFKFHNTISKCSRKNVSKCESFIPLSSSRNFVWSN